MIVDLKISLSTFKRLVKAGEKSGAIFESKGFIVMTVGEITVFAEKKTKDRIFDGVKKNGYRKEPVRSYPYLKAGYTSIAMGDSGGVDLSVEEAAEEIEAILESYDDETRAEILRFLEEVEA